MRFLILFTSILIVADVCSQNVGINTINPQEQLHLRSDSNRIALRMDSKKAGGVGFNYSTVTLTPSVVQNFESNSTYKDWTDLTVSKLVNSDDVRMNGPQIGLVPDLSNALRIQFTPSAAIPSTAEITNITLNAEWRRNGTFAGSLGFGIVLLKASNNQHLLDFPVQFVTSSTDIGVALPYQQLINPVTPDMINLGDVYILLASQFSYANGSTRLEIDRLWVEVEYREAATTSENVFWSAGADQGNFKITKSGNLATNQYFSIDESGVTQVKGLKLAQNAGAGKVLTSNNDGRAYWADPPAQNQDILWIKKDDTAYYATGPVQINNTAGRPALIFDKGASKINNGINLVETNNRLLNLILDANNDQANEQFNIYKDSTEALSQNPAIRFNLGGNDSWINGGGKLGIGNTNPAEQLDIAGAIRIGNNTNPTPVAGTIRWNAAALDFEGYDGTSWKSLTKCGSTTQNNNTGMPNSLPTCCEEQLTGSTAGAGNSFGNDVAIYGTYAAAIDKTNKIYFFKLENGVWAEDTVLTVPNCTNCLGESDAIEMSENYLLLEDAGYLNSTGRVFLYKRNNLGKWIQHQEIVNPANMQGQLFGNQIALSDDYFVAGSSTGGAGLYIFKRNLVNNIWEQEAYFSSQVCWGVSIFNNNRISVALPDQLVIYEKVGSFWGITQTLTTDIGFPAAIDMYGNYLVIGDVDNPNLIGRVKVYKRDTATNTWAQFQIITPSGLSTTSPNFFGQDVSIWGDYIIAGAPSADQVPANNDAKGRAYVYHFNGTTWLEHEIIIDPIGTAAANFARRVSTDGINRIIGVPLGDVNGSADQGKVVFGPID